MHKLIQKPDSVIVSVALQPGSASNLAPIVVASSYTDQFILTTQLPIIMASYVHDNTLAS